jgi:hypothetical protein
MGNKALRHKQLIFPYSVHGSKESHGGGARKPRYLWPQSAFAGVLSALMR